MFFFVKLDALMLVQLHRCLAGASYMLYIEEKCIFIIDTYFIYIMYFRVQWKDQKLGRIQDQNKI